MTEAIHEGEKNTAQVSGEVNVIHQPFKGKPQVWIE
ncbi:hypothetical protein SS209_00494 [Salmonella enterica subsp. enterica serovar Senftenberg str. SS209]|nr:hypothetical protein SS209_00494 [Salmonella enterica subsp. enterica serovar Senftenberg str. SS209]